jgi:predicted nucleotidyltransferase
MPEAAQVQYRHRIALYFERLAWDNVQSSPYYISKLYILITIDWTISNQRDIISRNARQGALGRRKLNDHSVQLKELGVKRMGLFGSFVRDEQTPESDIDLLVQFEPDKKSFDNFMELSSRLENLLERHVELVTTEGLSPYIGPHIMNEVEYASLSA